MIYAFRCPLQGRAQFRVVQTTLISCKDDEIGATCVLSKEKKGEAGGKNIKQINENA